MEAETYHSEARCCLVHVFVLEVKEEEMPPRYNNEYGDGAGWSGGGR